MREMKKRILFINNSLEGGGAERILIDILRRFDYARYEVDLALIFGVGVYLKDIPSSVNYLGSIYVPPPGVFSYAWGKTYRCCVCESFYIHRLVKGRYDIIISFLEGYAARYHQYIKHKAAVNITWVHVDLYAHHWSEICYPSKEAEAKVYTSMEKVVFVSQGALDAFRRLFCYRGNNLVVINNPIDACRILRLSDEFNVLYDTFSFVSVGRLSYQKRYDRMLRAVKILVNRGCVFDLYILGCGELEDEIKMLALELDIEARVKFLGFLPNPYPYIKGANALLLSSDAEGFSTVACEAMILGTPVVGTNVTGIRDLLGESEYGLLSDLTPEAFAEAMYLMYSDPALRELYAVASREKAKCFSQFDMDKIYALF